MEKMKIKYNFLLCSVSYATCYKQNATVKHRLESHVHDHFRVENDGKSESYISIN